MNPSSSIWVNPPPPGTEVEDEIPKLSEYSKQDKYKSIDPFVKNPEYIEYERRLSNDRIRHRHRRSRSRSHDRHYPRSDSRDRHRHKKDKRRRSKSKSRSRKRSRSRGRHRRHHSRSRSRSRSRHRHRRHKRSSSSDYRSSRSSSRSHSYKSHRSKYSRSKRSRSYSDMSINDFDEKHEPETKEEDVEEEEEEEAEPPKENAFKNDGSFLEMFKKMQEQKQAEEAAKHANAGEEKKAIPMFGKRRGGRVLKTGLVQKTRNLQEDLNDPQDAWSVYMKEVKKYKEACCDDDSKTRPLVK